MRDIFTNLYNKVVSFFHQEDAKNVDSAKDVACNRLKLVLMQDRTNLSPAIMDRMKHELIDLLSKYVELDKELVDLNFEQEDNQMALMLSIPVIRAKDEKEIEGILAEDEVSEPENEGVEEETSNESEETDEESENIEDESLDKEETTSDEEVSEEEITDNKKEDIISDEDNENNSEEEKPEEEDDTVKETVPSE